MNVYKNGAVKFNAADGKAIVKIAATMKSKSFSQMTASTGTTTENTWEGNTTEVSFSATALMTFLQFTVTTADATAETVKPAEETYDVEAANIAAFNAVEDGKVVKLALKDARVNGYYNSYYVEDATGATAFRGLNLTVGDVLNGYVIGTKNTDNNIDYMGNEANPVEYQLTATDGSTFTTASGTLVGTTMTIPEACTMAAYGRLVTLKNVTISGSGQNKTLRDADDN